MLTLFVLVLATAQQPTPTNPPRRPAPTTTSMEILVTDRLGRPTAHAEVVAEGPSSRAGVTDANGLTTFHMVPGGTYRVRATCDGFVALEKEVTVRPGAATSLQFALSAAPPPPPPPPPPPAPSPPPPPPVTSTIAPGEPRTLSVPDLAERSLGGREPVRAVPIGCSGLSQAQLFVVRETREVPARIDADEMLYIIAGEGTIQLAGKAQVITPGWFSIVPRGMTYSVTRKGKNPTVLLSIIGGQPCAPVIQ